MTEHKLVNGKDKYNKTCIGCGITNYDITHYLNSCEKYKAYFKQNEKLKKVQIKNGEDGANLSINTKGELVIVAFNQGGWDATEVDLKDLLKNIKIHLPELLKGLK